MGALAARGLLVLPGLGCGPQFPPSWLIPAEPSAVGGGVEPAGKLRVLAIAAEPPEVAPASPPMRRCAPACHDQAVARGGVSPDPDHWVIAVKLVQVKASDRPSRNPALAGFYLGAAASLPALGPGGGSYPRLAADLADAQRPQLTLAAERAADAVQAEPDPQQPAAERPETLGISFFTTACTLEAGRGSFLELGCSAEPTLCPQRQRAAVSWQLPAARARSQRLLGWSSSSPCCATIAAAPACAAGTRSGAEASAALRRRARAPAVGRATRQPASAARGSGEGGG